MAQLFPRSVTGEHLDALLTRLARIDAGLLEALPFAGARATQEADTFLQDLQITAEICLKRTREYFRSARLCSLLKHIPPGEPAFDDHDGVASLLLYMLLYYARIAPDEEALDGSAGSYSYLPWLMQKWSEVSLEGDPVDRLLSDESCVDWGLTNPSVPIDVGVVTVLEHEYQSVLRRLDSIEESSDEHRSGLSILNRISPDQDLKELGGISARNREFGWARGRIGSHSVFVICTGRSGKLAAETSVKAAISLLGILPPPKRWFVVGVCAASRNSVPLGGVLVSSGVIFDMSRSHSDRYLPDPRVVIPLKLTIPGSNTFSMVDCFRRVPELSLQDAKIASKDSVPVHGVKFACVDHVVNRTSDRNAILRLLRDSKKIVPGEQVGIEMEGAGLPIKTPEKVVVIKGICDYADTRTKAKLDPATKNRLQLFAAETAAEYVAQVLRAE